MRTVILAAALAATCGAGFLLATPASAAGAIESACLRSDRAGATRALCACIQSVANQTLSKREQRMAADFFKDPQKAQEIRMSKSASHNEFWRRYKAFGASATTYCSAG